MKTNKPFKIISDVDASNFPVLADFVGKRILATEYYKALDGKDFDIINEEAEATREEGDTRRGGSYQRGGRYYSRRGDKSRSS